MYLTFNRVTPRRTLNGAAFTPLLDDMLAGFFPPARREHQSQDGAPGALAARFDLIEKVDRFEASIEMPGVAKEDIDVQIDGAEVSVKAATKSEETVKDGVRVLHEERVSKSWTRSFTLPAEVADERAEASYENGVLKLTLPKKEVVQPKRIAIK